MRNHKLLLMAGVLFVLTLASACVPISAPAGGGSTVPSVPAGSDPLSGTSWRLDQMAGADGVLADVPDGVEVTLAFDNGSASGSGGCNRYNAAYTVEGQSGLTFGPAASTMMACVGPQGDVEQQYFAMLATVTGFENAQGTLSLWDADQNVVASFSAVVPVSLVGTNWLATSVNNGNNGVQTVAEGTSITAVFGEDGMLSGMACNNYNFGYAVEGDSITIQQGASTMMACPDPVEMDQESAYLMMLPQAATFSIDGANLELRTADGALIAAYVAD